MSAAQTEPPLEQQIVGLAIYASIRSGGAQRSCDKPGFYVALFFVPFFALFLFAFQYAFIRSDARLRAAADIPDERVLSTGFFFPLPGGRPRRGAAP